jgi:isopentenyl-diphosphate delta-isomerase
LRTKFCDKELSAPLWLSAPTFVARDTKFEECLAHLAQRNNLGLCTGNIAPLISESTCKTVLELRHIAPDALIIAGMGIKDLTSSNPRQIVEAAQNLGANGLAVFLQAAQAVVECDGKPDLRGTLESIAGLCAADSSFPVLVKDAGCGLSYLDGAFLQAIGVRRVEICGLGGSSPLVIAAHSEDSAMSRLGEMLSHWGVPAAAVTEWLSTQGFEVVATGGVQNALDGAAALALGAHMIGLTDPLVRHYRKGGPQRVESFLDEMLHGLKTVLLLCGARKPKDMPGVPRILGADLGRWIAAGPSAL